MERFERQLAEIHALVTEQSVSEKLWNKIMQNLRGEIAALPEDALIGIRPWSEETRYLLEFTDLSKKCVRGIFDKVKRRGNAKGIPFLAGEEIEKFPVQYMIVASFHNRNAIMAEVKETAVSMQIIDIYEALEKAGIELKAPFYRYVSGGHENLNYYYRQYIKKQSEQTARELLAAALEAKDFLMVFDICQKEMELSDGRALTAKTIWEKTGTLLADVRKAIEARAARDIWVFWMDAVYAGWLKKMPELNKLSEQSLFFEKCYTCTPYTHPTLRAMLSGWLPIDDYEKSKEKLDSSNSDLLSGLEKRGFRFLHIGHDSKKRETMKAQYSINMEPEASCTGILWKGILAALNSPSPIFLLLHFITETHPPVVAADMDSELIGLDIYRAEEAQKEKKLNEAYRYLDRRLSLFSKNMLGGRDTLQIFMSDHGHHLSSPAHYWDEEKLHSCLFILGNNVFPRKIKSFFQYIHFRELIWYLIDPVDNSLESALSAYAIFQDIDVYSEILVDSFIERGLPECAISYRGAMSDKYKYAVDALGNEFYYKKLEREEKWEPLANGQNEIFERLRELAGNNFLNIEKDKQFLHAKRLRAEAIKKLGTKRNEKRS